MWLDNFQDTFHHWCISLQHKFQASNIHLDSFRQSNEFHHHHIGHHTKMDIGFHYCPIDRYELICNYQPFHNLRSLFHPNISTHLVHIVLDTLDSIPFHHYLLDLLLLVCRNLASYSHCHPYHQDKAWNLHHNLVVLDLEDTHLERMLQQ